MFSKTRTPKKYCITLLYSCVLLVSFFAFIAPAGASNLDALNNSCVDCHRTLSPFTDEQSRFNEIRQNHTERNISCSLECHEDIIRKKATDNFQQWSDSGHSAYYVTCDACHGGNPRAKTEAEAHASMKGINDSNSSIYFKNIPETCGKCHTEELDHFKNTMHYQRLQSESRAPSCVTCHKPHTFRVLKASELVPLCSVCHNPVDQIADASVPKDAKNALEKATELQEDVLRAKNAVADAKAKGKDVTSAQLDLDKATAVMDSVPSLWHGFNLKDFDQQVNNGIDWAKRAQFKTSDAEPTVPARAPGVGIAAAFGIFAILYLIRKR
jgi:hypothetical protein